VPGVGSAPAPTAAVGARQATVEVRKGKQEAAVGGALALEMLDARLPSRLAPASNGRAAPCLVPDKGSGLVGFPTRPRAPAKVPGIKKITLINR